MMTQGGQYFRCDVCKDPAQDFTVHLPWNQVGGTIAAANAAGWHVRSANGIHICPRCLDKIEGDDPYEKEAVP